jgi:penicillin-binding protein 1B
VRGVLDANGKAVNRYDKDPAPAQEGDAIAARLITIAGQQTVTSGTAASLMRDGLGRLNAAGKTGTSNDGRDSWFAGWTGDHLAVVWVGNDQNKETGLYGATGAMRVWSSIFARLPSAPLQVGDKGIDWQWTIGSNTTDAACAGARRFAYVAGFAPAYTPCPISQPVAEEGGGWREWFGIGRDKDDEEEQREPAPQQASPPEQQ